MSYPIRLGEEPTKKRRKKKQTSDNVRTGIKLIDDDIDVPPPIEPERIQRGQKEEYSPGRIKRSNKRKRNVSPKRNEDDDFDDLPRNKFVENNDDFSPPRRRVVTEEPDDLDDLPRKRVKREDSSDDDSRADKSMQIKIDGKVPKRIETKKVAVDPKVLEKEKRDWALGTKQKIEFEQRQLDYLKELEKPFSRSVEDKELEDNLKSQMRFGDPMANYGKKSKKKDKKSKKSEKPKYSGPPPPPNRFNIPPGFRWDGIDRTNGFEKKYFRKTAERKALTEVAYKWSVEDM